MEKKTKIGIATFCALLSAVSGGKIVSELGHKSNDNSDTKAYYEEEKTTSDTTTMGTTTTTSSTTTTGITTTMETTTTGTTTTEDNVSTLSVTSTMNTTSLNGTTASNNTSIETTASEPTTTVVTEITKTDDFDYSKCYQIMDEMVNVYFSKFFGHYESLSEALVSNYDIELTDEQKSRYDNVMRDTYNLYVSGLEAYKNDDMDSFRNICDKITSDSSVLNDSDLVNIVSMNVNKQGDYIKDSSNYSFSSDGITIDGYEVKDLIVEDTYGDNDLIMFELPSYVSSEAVSPSNLTIMVNNTVYAYNNEKLLNTINGIEQDYCEKLGFDRISVEFRDSKHILVGCNEDTKTIIDNTSCPGLMEAKLLYSRMIDPRIKIGMFDGKGIHDYILSTKDGRDVSIDTLIGEKEFFDYIAVTSVDIPESFEPFMGDMTLSSVLMDKFGATLTEEQKARYDVIMKETYAAYIRAKKAYQSGKIGEFKSIISDISNGKYLNTDDLVFMIASLVNKKRLVSIDAGTPGYHLVIKNENGEIVDEWISTNMPHIISNLDNGNYSLITTLAPEGYEVSTEYTNFTVTSNNVVVENPNSIKATLENVISNPSNYSIVDGALVFDEMTIKNGSEVMGFILPNNLMSIFAGCNNEIEPSRVLHSIPVFVSYLANNEIPFTVSNNEVLIYDTSEVEMLGKAK